MMNIYNGNVVLDANGEGVVGLPEWFGALNRDYRSGSTRQRFIPYPALRGGGNGGGSYGRQQLDIHRSISGAPGGHSSRGGGYAGSRRGGYTAPPRGGFSGSYSAALRGEYSGGGYSAAPRGGYSVGATAHLADTLVAMAAVIAPRSAVVDITAAVAADTSVAGAALPRPRAPPHTTKIREQQGS